MPGQHDLVIHGLLTFLDPPKETAGPAIAALQDIGVAVKVLTGDNAVVTSKICRQVGLEPGTPLLGTQIESMDDATLQLEVEQRTVKVGFATTIGASDQVQPGQRHYQVVDRAGRWPGCW